MKAESRGLRIRVANYQLRVASMDATFYSQLTTSNSQLPPYIIPMLRSIASALVCIAWGLWFGGLGALFLFATRLFAEDRETALKAAPMMFLAFERYQLILAAVALVGVVIWRISTGSIRVTVVFSLLAIATIPAALGPMLITSRMEALRVQDQSSSPEFRKLHGISMIVYTGETFILLITGTTLPWAIRAKNPADQNPILQ